MTQQFPDVEPDLDTSATNNPIAMEAPALFDLGGRGCHPTGLAPHRPIWGLDHSTAELAPDRATLERNGPRRLCGQLAGGI